MKKLIEKVLVIFLVLLLFPAVLPAVSLTEVETRLMNDISQYIDIKPEGQALRFFEHAIKSDSAPLKGLAAIILDKHYQRRFHGLFLRNFTLNPAVEPFERDKKVLVKLENTNRLLAAYEGSLKGLRDERVRQLFLFYHFRHKNVWLLGTGGEELSLASFYRITVFNRILGESIDSIGLAARADMPADY